MTATRKSSEASTLGNVSTAHLKRLIKESNLIEGISDPAEIKQSMVAWDYIYDHNFPLTHGAICRVQKIITINQDLLPHQRGYYRDMSQTNVRVGSYTPPDYGFVPGMMSNWLLDYGDDTPWVAHVAFEHIHPFVDGNGRTGRMLMWWMEVKGSREPTLIKFQDRQRYYEALSSQSKVWSSNGPDAINPPSNQSKGGRNG